MSSDSADASAEEPPERAEERLLDALRDAAHIYDDADTDNFLRSNWARFADATIDKLSEPEKAWSDEFVEKKVTDAQDRAKQAHEFRDELFRTIKWTLICTLIAAVGVMVAYIVSAWGRVAPAVMVSFFGAVVVQTIGLAYIVANYVFDRERRSE